MTIINVMVDDQRLEFSSMPVVASEGVKETYVKFALSSDWSGYGATALFYRDDSPEDVYTSVLDGAGLAEVPYEITAAPGWIRFGLSGSDGTSVHTSEILKYKVVKGMYTSGQGSEPPAPGIYEQMLAIAGDMRNTLNAAVIEQNAIIQGLVSDMDDLRSDMETEQTTFENVVTGQINTLVNNFAGSSRETVLFSGSHQVNVGNEIDLVSSPTVYDYLDIVLNDDLIGTIIGPTQNSHWRVTGETIKSTGASVTTYVVEGVLDGNTLRVTEAAAIVDTGTASTRYDLEDGPLADESLRRYCLKVIGRKLTDDAEVLNIRVGADGVTYQTAGTAVRSQLEKKLNAPISGGTVDYGTSGQLLATDGQGNTEWVDSVIPDASITVAKLAPGVIDSTYQIQGAAAASVTVGQSLAAKANAADLNNLNDQVTDISDRVATVEGLGETVNGITELNYTENKNITSAGVIVDDETSCLSELIPLTWTWDSATYNRFYFNKADGQPDNYYYVVFYDENQNYIGFKGSSGTEYRAVMGVDSSAFVRFSFRKGTVGKLTDRTGNTTYWTAQEIVTQKGLVQNVGDLGDLDTTDKDSLVSAINEVKSDIPESPLPITPRDTDFFHISKNLINPSECVTGEYVNQTTGAFSPNASHTRTGYVDIEPSTEYVVRYVDFAPGVNFRYAFYTVDKTFISGAAGALPDMLLTSPANAEYIAISDTHDVRDYMIAQYVNEDKSYEAYDNVYLLPEYIKQDMSDVLLNVPSKVYALVGFETNIYFENITEDWTKYAWDVTCTKGQQLERGYRITPTASDVGSYTLTIKASLNESIYKEVTTTIIVTSASAGNGQTKTVIVLGDSTTDNGKVIEKLHEDLANDVMSVTTLGTRGTAPNNHEGRSGWSWDTYFTKASVTYTDGRGTIYNPFYNPNTQTFDASYYFANSGIAVPDVFIVNMGINDVFRFASDSAYETGITTILERANTAVQSILDATTDTKVCVCLTIPPNHSQDAFGKGYNCGQTRDRYKRNNTLWVNALINLFKNRESERVYIIPINACLDTVYNMGMETMPVNARNTDITYQSPIGNGGVHPVVGGYWQIADVYTAFIKGTV